MAALFFIMVVASLIKLTITDPGSVLAVALSASGSGVQLAITLAGIYIVWMGIIQVAIDAGLIDALGRVCRPLIEFLFGKQTDEVNALLATNISANMIGAGNAATPAAIQAIEKMATPNQVRATTAMIMLFVLSATSMQILPTTVISILESHGAANASNVILPTFVTSTLITIVGVVLVKVLARCHSEQSVRNATKGEESLPRTYSVIRRDPSLHSG